MSAEGEQFDPGQPITSAAFRAGVDPETFRSQVQGTFPAQADGNYGIWLDRRVRKLTAANDLLAGKLGQARADLAAILALMVRPVGDEWGCDLPGRDWTDRELTVHASKEAAEAHALEAGRIMAEAQAQQEAWDGIPW